jgi:hypothetical protein
MVFRLVIDGGTNDRKQTADPPCKQTKAYPIPKGVPAVEQTCHAGHKLFGPSHPTAASQWTWSLRNSCPRGEVARATEANTVAKKWLGCIPV